MAVERVVVIENYNESRLYVTEEGLVMAKLTNEDIEKIADLVVERLRGHESK